MVEVGKRKTKKTSNQLSKVNSVAQKLIHDL